MRKPAHLTDLAWALLKAPCAVEDLTPGEAQALYDRGYITAPRLGWVWPTRAGQRMQFEIAASIPDAARRGGLGGFGSEEDDAGRPRVYNFPENAEWVPTETLWNMREYDRHLTNRPGVERVMKSLKTYGWVSPASVTYYQRDRTALLSEGNHRVAAAWMLGIGWSLAVVHRNMAHHGDRSHTSRAAVPVLGAVPQHDAGFRSHDDQGRTIRLRDIADHDIDSGKLVTVDAFHGTSRAFSRFTTPRGFPRGFYFTTAYDVAARYAGAGQQFGPKRVIQARLHFRRPLVVTTPEAGAEAQVHIDALEARGFDAIVRRMQVATRRGMEDGFEIAVFNDAQIEQYEGHVNADLRPSDIGLPARPLSAVDLVLDGKPIL